MSVRVPRLRRRLRPRGASAAPSIYLVGTSGHPNYGDELIAAAWVRFYSRCFPDAEIWLDSPRPGQSAVLLRGLHRQLYCVDTLYHVCWNAPTSTVDDIVSFGARAVREPGLVPREVTGIDVAVSADLVHIIGGGYVNALWPHHLALLSAVRTVAQISGARTAMTGAGLTPAAAGSSEHVADLLADFDVVDVRDGPSAQLLAGRVPAASMTGDDALLALPTLPRRAGDLPATVVCLQQDLLAEEQTDVADAIVRILTTWGVDHDPVLLLECLPPDDLRAAAYLSRHLPRLQVLPFDELWRHGFPSRPGQRWLSTRFHPHLVAAATGCWGVALSVGGDYYGVKHQSLVDQGSGWTVLSDLQDEVVPGTAPSAPFSGRLAGLEAAKQAVAQSVAALARD